MLLLRLLRLFHVLRVPTPVEQELVGKLFRLGDRVQGRNARVDDKYFGDFIAHLLASIITTVAAEIQMSLARCIVGTVPLVLPV